MAACSMAVDQEPGAATGKDAASGAACARASLPALLKGFPVFDVDQVEVLRGPQGTLFGRNSPAGVIKVDSAKPVFRTEGYLSGGFGKDGVKNLEGAFNVPVSDTVALRFPGQTQRRDDRVHNPRPAGTRDFEGDEDSAARLQVLAPGNPQSPFYGTQNQSAKSYAAFGSLNYAVSDALKLRAGLRYTTDKKDFSAKRVEATTAGPFNLNDT